MPVDPLVGRLGGLTLPLRPADFSGSFTAADPARSRLMALFKAAVTYELNAVWERATANCSPLFNKAPVQDWMELEPTYRVLQDRKTDFPLMALHRVGKGDWFEHTLDMDRRDQDWRFYYILPPLKTEDFRRTADVLMIVAEIVRKTIRNHGHIAYENGAPQWFGDQTGIGAIKIKSQMIGQSPFVDDENAPMYPALVLEIATSEYGYDSADEFSEFEGIDYHVGLATDEGTIPEFVEGFDDVPPPK